MNDSSVSKTARSGSVELSSVGPFQAKSTASIVFDYRPQRDLPAGSVLWMFMDIRQTCGQLQHTDPNQPNYFEAQANSSPVETNTYRARTLDLYPQVVEFLYVAEVHFPEGTKAVDTVTIQVGGGNGLWQLPEHPIQKFRFWFVESEPGSWTFEPTGFKTYRKFESDTMKDALPEVVAELSIEVQGKPPAMEAADTRKTPGILWGDLHGMAFNQRPIDDYYRYARDVSGYDFAAAMLFTYNTCVDGVWKDVKETAREWTEPGKFIAVVGVEAGTVPDGSHRNAHFFQDPYSVPPIFCEDREPALDPRLHQKFSPDTILCQDLEDYYQTVEKYQAVVSGHFHTLTYHKGREMLAEIWQKQAQSAKEEERIFQMLNEGYRLGIISGCDTHDSMPGNPDPEPGCPQPSGQTGVIADALTHDALEEALRARRVFATTGARIAMHFSAGDSPMGSIVPKSFPRAFEFDLEGPRDLARVELIRNGEIVDTIEINRRKSSGTFEIEPWTGGGPEWYVLRATQEDRHRAWSSPIWFE